MLMRHALLVAVGLFASGPALADTESQTTGQANPKPATAAQTGTTPHPASPKAPSTSSSAASAPASTPESRSAAALALSHEPTFDEGSAQRIRDAALSYADLAVRGGWPTIPTDAKFAQGTPGAHDDILRTRLIMSAISRTPRAAAPSTRSSPTQ